MNVLLASTANGKQTNEHIHRQSFLIKPCFSPPRNRERKKAGKFCRRRINCLFLFRTSEHFCARPPEASKESMICLFSSSPPPSPSTVVPPLKCQLTFFPRHSPWVIRAAFIFSHCQPLEFPQQKFLFFALESAKSACRLTSRSSEK